jgi:pimeloyl-ACP methyl ester carboxylesterase
MLGSKDSPKHAALCARVAASGWLALRFDFAGRGESEGDPGLVTASNEVADLATALAALRGLVGDGPLAVAGSSLGGTVAVLVAARDRGLAGLATVAAPADLPTKPRPGWASGLADPELGRFEAAPGVFLSTELFRDALRHDVRAAARRVACPWLVVHGRSDEVVPAASAAELAAAGRRTELRLHAEADHRFSAPDHREWLLREVSGFVAGLAPA